MIRTGPTRPIDEIARLGDEIYERDVRPQVEADHHGEVVAIDVESGMLGHRRERDRRDGPPAGAAPGGDRCLVPAGRAPGAASLRGAFPAVVHALAGAVNAAYEAVVAGDARGCAEVG